MYYLTVAGASFFLSFHSLEEATENIARMEVMDKQWILFARAIAGCYSRVQEKVR